MTNKEYNEGYVFCTRDYLGNEIYYSIINNCGFETWVYDPIEAIIDNDLQGAIDFLKNCDIENIKFLAKEYYDAEGPFELKHIKVSSIVTIDDIIFNFD